MGGNKWMLWRFSLCLFHSLSNQYVKIWYILKIAIFEDKSMNGINSRLVTSGAVKKELEKEPMEVIQT